MEGFECRNGEVSPSRPPSTSEEVVDGCGEQGSKKTSSKTYKSDVAPSTSSATLRSAAIHLRSAPPIPSLLVTVQGSERSTLRAPNELDAPRFAQFRNRLAPPAFGNDEQLELRKAVGDRKEDLLRLIVELRIEFTVDVRGGEGEYFDGGEGRKEA